ncbi:MAG: pilus assembly protein [Endomicrobium sp.]|jgi:hypothetical protein|uniref:TadE family protein n=1 Tax=Candidatus Endomicrobiellum cubanum TaxID=3242325 RepID=UPI00283558D6|nr:pilus assembly protein [Endomicrobium sp.]
MKYLKQLRGQALVEAALIAPLIVVFLFAVVWFASLMLTWQQILTATEYGIDLITYTNFDKKYIENDIKNYLCDAKTLGRVLDLNRLIVKVEINDYKPVDVDIDFIKPDIPSFGSLDIVKGLVPKNSFVEITYSYKIPKILKVIGKETIKIRSKLEVLSGTGSKKYTWRK